MPKNQRLYDLYWRSLHWLPDNNTLSYERWLERRVESLENEGKRNHAAISEAIIALQTEANFLRRTNADPTVRSGIYNVLSALRRIIGE